MDFTVRSASSRPHLSRRRTGLRNFRTILPAAACVATLSVASTSVEAVAQESPLTAIISEISKHEADVDRINLEIGNLREAVNQALVDLHDAQSLAEQARRGAAEARERLNQTQADVERAQEELDQISRSSYRSSGANGTPVHADADARKDSLDRQTFLRKESEEKQRALEDLQRARTEAANNESTLRQASRLADERAAKAEEAEANARTTLNESLASLETQMAQRDAASTELEEAQAELAEQRPEAAAEMGIETDAAPAPAVGESAVPETSTEETPAPVEEPEAPETEAAADVPTEETETSQASEAQEEDTPAAEPVEEAEAAVEAPAAPESAPAPSLNDFANPDTVEAALDAFAQAVGQTQAEHSNFDDPYANAEDSEESVIASPSSSIDANEEVAATDEEEGTTVADVLPDVNDAKEVTDALRGTEEVADGDRAQQIEAVIARAESQIGTPYVWGGGDANGATMGLDGNGYNGKAGFDCSGLTLYAFAGVGISLPHYTGYQYQRGTQVPASQMQRGDLLFWGAGGSQHVAIYLGDGMMIEAPQTGMNVQKSPVRHNGMTPNVVRLI